MLRHKPIDPRLPGWRKSEPEQEPEVYVLAIPAYFRCGIRRDESGDDPARARHVEEILARLGL